MRLSFYFNKQRSIVPHLIMWYVIKTTDKSEPPLAREQAKLVNMRYTKASMTLELFFMSDDEYDFNKSSSVEEAKVLITCITNDTSSIPILKFIKYNLEIYANFYAIHVY
jgi:hypothetical protein